MRSKALLTAVGLAVAALLVPTAVATAPTVVAATAASATTPKTAHFTVNLRGSYAAAKAAGFNVFDVAGSTSNPAGVRSKLNALPKGSKAMVWVGNLGKAAGKQGFTRAQFKAQVNALARDPRVYGYFIADEPHPTRYPSVVAEIRARADYIRAVAPAQKSFIVVLDGSNYCGKRLGCEYAALAPAKTHVDIVGVDSYPCSTRAGCKFGKITERVNTAVRAGIPRNKIAPVYQTFGQAGGYYRMPTAAELKTMLATWRANVPSPPLDYAYSWGTQSSAPQALVNYPAQQLVVKAHNAR
ncbi:hypothetical protein N864_21835 [Intrasporangium chromatireducens Q5-1]|uniref:Glucanase n=1 Tax=Intrasporangium chromatireducens Q5-1 TaxID=584657 RepID=W9GHR5_9MICO|nr:hypothetical protein [Intrasporangium chromatireducens]EWT05771.1 hypothetical protein N864_21835 [Intrasporangium chromatireducens Q5-1]